MGVSLRDVLIIGAGPAGLSAAQYCARADLDVLAAEFMAPGGQTNLIDQLENYPGFPGGISGFDFSRKLYEQAQAFGADFVTAEALSLKKDAGLFEAALDSGDTVRAQAVILATGAAPKKLAVPGEAEFYGRGVSYCGTCDGPFFKGKKILVVGGGDTACGEAQYLSRLADRLVLIHRRGEFRAQKALSGRVLGNPRIEVRLNTRLLEIRGDAKVQSVVLQGEKQYEEAFDAVFIFAGIVPRTDLVPGAKLDEGGFVLTDQTMASSIPGLFAAGDVRAGPFRQVVVAAGEGAVAAHAAAAYIDAMKAGI
jgi:thioredoxin reductase (NADPH)